MSSLTGGLNKSEKISTAGETRFAAVMKNLVKYRALYIMAIPGILYYIIFHYIPLAGTVIAFQDYNIFKGVLGSDFVGFEHFKKFFGYAEFWNIFKNTLLINIYDILLSFPAPIILALLINEVTHTKFKRSVQTIIYLPHFLSWVVVGSIFATQLLSPETGLINHLLKFFGMDPVYFMSYSKYAKIIVVLAGIWRDTGWGTIMYLAAIAGISPSLYDAARVDGAGYLRQTFSITIPSILPVMMTIFLVKIGHFMDYGFEKIWVFRNGANQEAIEIFDTYIYWNGLLQSRYSYATAIGIFKSLIGFTLLFGANKISLKLTEQSLF